MCESGWWAALGALLKRIVQESALCTWHEARRVCNAERVSASLRLVVDCSVAWATYIQRQCISYSNRVACRFNSFEELSFLTFAFSLAFCHLFCFTFASVIIKRSLLLLFNRCSRAYCKEAVNSYLCNILCSALVACSTIRS